MGNGTDVDEDRLLKVVMLEALERGSKIEWVQNLKQRLETFGWGKSDVYSLEKGKIEKVGSLMEQECEGHFMMVRRRRRLMKLREGTTELEVA